jgi:hypothetical protein
MRRGTLMNSSTNWLMGCIPNSRSIGQNPNIALLIAAVLDPCMKADFIKFYFYTVGENVDLKMRELKWYLKKYYLQYEKIVRIHSLPVFSICDEQPTSKSGTSSLGQVCGKRHVEFAFAQFASQNSDARSERSELDIYLEDPRILVMSDENFNVLFFSNTQESCVSLY